MTSKKDMANLARKRAEKLPAERRREIGKMGASARWDKDLPKATNDGVLTIGGTPIACAVLETRKRVLTQETFLMALGRAGKAKGGKGSSQMVDGLPPFLAVEQLKTFISEDLIQSTTPIIYRTKTGQRAYGYDATLLPKVCEVYLKARDAGALLQSQKHIAMACEVLLRGLAQVGIIAMVDEATGYQYERARDDLNKILEAYISQELLPWTKRFPDEFFRQVYRVHGWDYREGQHRHTPYLGKLINKYVYEKLPHGVLPELQRLNPPTPKGWRRHKHFQFLSEDVGNPHLEKHLVKVTTLLQVSSTKSEFDGLVKKAFPKGGDQLPLELDGDE